MNKVRIAVDVMGGDEEPQVVLDGIDAALAADADLEVLAVGPAELVEPFASSRDRVEALVAPDVITMEDDPIQAVMRKRKSSIVLACRAVKKGQAAGFFSAGATGAMTAAATAYVTPFKYMTDEGEKRPIRPCIVSAIPNRKGAFTVFCDLGANPDVDPEDIVRFAQMGATYARIVCGIANPRVGLLSNGTEDTKGSHFTKECFPLMQKKVKGFAGNCEGTDFTSGNFDVVVCDGFAGNVALKAMEGITKALFDLLRQELTANSRTKLGAALVKPALRRIKKRMNAEEIGGVPMLGVLGAVVKAHGNSSAKAFFSAVRQAYRMLEGNVTDIIRSELQDV